MGVPELLRVLLNQISTYDHPPLNINPVLRASVPSAPLESVHVDVDVELVVTGELQEIPVPF